MTQHIFVAAVMPAKGRPEQTLDCIRRLVGTAGTRGYALAVVVDDDPDLAALLRGGIDHEWPVKLFTTSRRFGYWGAPYTAPSPYGMAYAPPTAEQELHALQSQAEYFSGALEDIKKRIKELEADKKTE